MSSDAAGDCLQLSPAENPLPHCVLQHRARERASGSRWTPRWREMDFELSVLVARVSICLGRRDCCLEIGSGSVGGTEGSNPSPSREESANPRSLSSGRREGLLLWRRLFARPLHCIGLATAMADWANSIAWSIDLPCCVHWATILQMVPCANICAPRLVGAG
jgi:hypothetical protein